MEINIYIYALGGRCSIDGHHRSTTVVLMQMPSDPALFIITICLPSSYAAMRAVIHIAVVVCGHAGRDSRSCARFFTKIFLEDACPGPRQIEISDGKEITKSVMGIKLGVVAPDTAGTRLVRPA
jgi:hypothetical protein